MTKTIEWTKEQIETVTKNAITVMMNSPEHWGSSDYNLNIDVEDLRVCIDHNTIENSYECTTTSMYSFDTDGWFDTDEDEDGETVYTPIGNADEWAGSPMFEQLATDELAKHNSFIEEQNRYEA